MAMSSLQLGLAIGGGLVLAAVVAHGAWTSRKNAPRQAMPTESDGRNDPQGLDGSYAAAGPQIPSLNEFDSANPSDHFAIPAPEKKPALDALIDAIAPLVLESAVSGDAALAAMPATRRVGSKP